MSVAIVDSFKKIKLLPDGTELIADKTSDTLTLKAGTGVNFLVSADGTAGTSPGQGPVVEIYNTGQGLAVLNDVLKFGNVSNQSMTVGAATIDNLLIDNSQIIQTDNTKDIVWRTQTTSYTLVPAGTTPPTPSGSGPYSVTFPLSTQAVAPATNVWYFVADNANPSYNGIFKATASSTTSLTLEYQTNPGVYGIQATSLTANGTVVQINFAPQSTVPFTPYVDNAGDYVTVTGFTSTGAVYNGTYPVKTAGLTYVTFDSGNNVAISSGYGIVTKPTTGATPNGTNNTVALTNNLIIASTQGIKVPIGTSAQRPTGPLPLAGFMRYNTDLGAFEGYVGTAGWASLGGVRSVDGYTYISAESTPGNSDDTLRFYTSTNGPGSFLSLTIDKDNTTILTKGLIVPKGNSTTERPASPVAGMLRFNTTDNIFEGYANGVWSGLGGVRSVDGQTLVRAETSAGASNDRLDFITSLNTSVTSTTDIGDIITVGSTANLYVGQPIEFVGTIVGGVTAGVTYYVKTINSLNITISTLADLSTTQAISPDTSGSPMYIVTKAFTADKDNVIFYSKGMTIPVGTTALRPASPVTGQIRFNTDTGQFEGYLGSNWSSLGGVRSVDGLTYILAETSAGASDDTLHFYTATSSNATAEAASLNNSGMTLYSNRYVAFRENSSVGTREAKIKAPDAFDVTYGSYTLTLPTKLGSAGNFLGLDDATGTLAFFNPDTGGGLKINVSAVAGDDTNDGINKPVKTIKKALQIASGLVYTASNSFNSDICYRDTGLILEAIGWDLAYGSNWQTIKAGLTYSQSAASLVLTAQKTITVNALKYLQVKAVATQSGNPATITNAKAQVVVDIVNGSSAGTILPIGSGVVPAVTMPTPTGAVSNAGNTKDRLLANVAFLKAEASAWIDAQIAGNIAPFVGFTYTGTSRTKCERDIEFIVYSTVYDYIYGGNSQSIDAGLKYWDALGTATTLQVTSQAQTAATIARIKSFAQTIASGGTVTKTPANAQNQVTTPAGVDSNASATIGNNFDIISNILTYGVGAAPGNIWLNFTYSQAACERDVKYLVDSIRYDAIFNSNYRTVSSALRYLMSSASLVTASQKLQTTSALAQAQILTVAKLSDATLITRANALWTEVIDIINNGAGAADAYTYPTPTGGSNNAYTAGYLNARNQLLLNKNFIKDEIISWISYQVTNGLAPFSTGFTYNSTTCSRDVGLIVDALIYDLTYGGNLQTYDAAKAYFDANTAQYGNGEKEEVLAAMTRLKAVVGYVINENTSWTKYTALSQDVSGTAGDASAVTAAQDRVQEIYTTISSNGTLPTKIDPDITWTSATFQTQFAALNATAQADIATGTTDWIAAKVATAGPTITYPTATFTDATYSTTSGTLTTAKATLISAKATIQTATVASAAVYVPNGKKIVVAVNNGDYYEDNPIIVPDNVSVLGAGLRSTILRPLNANKDLLRVRNGAYFGEFTFRDHLANQSPTGVPDFTWDYAVAFDDPTDSITSRVGYTLPVVKPTITTSPYIQAVTIISFLGGNGAYVDGNKVNTPNIPTNQIEAENPVSGPAPEYGKSMVANAFTMISFGGTGWRLTNDAYAQIVSCFQIFMLHGSYCLSGGYLSITNSATNFGAYALRSSGYSPNAFQFDKGYVVGTGLITGGIQTITAIGFGRAPTVHYITRFRTPDYKIAYDLINADKAVIQDAVINAGGTAGWAFSFLTTTVTAFTTATSIFTASSTANFTVGEKVEFTGTTFGGISVGSTYYIKTIPSTTTFTLSTSSDLATTYTFGSNASGSMTMKFKHDTSKSNRDVGLVIDAINYDLYTGGNQQSVLAGQSYWTAGTLTSGLTGEVTQCLSMLRVARGLTRAYVATEITNAAVLGGYGLVANWTGGTAGTLAGATLTPLSAVFTSTISGNILTITTLTSGTIAVGMALSGGSVTAGTYIVGTNGVGTGNGSTWILNQTATGTPTAAGSTGFTTGDIVTIWAGNSNATATVTASAGVVTALAVSNPGTNYSATGTQVTASVASSIVGKYDLIIGILADYSIAPTAVQYGNASDVSSNYIPSGTTYSFNAATQVNTTTNTITVPYTGQSTYLGNSKKITYSANGNGEISGLDSGQAYYLGGVVDNGSTTSFNLYYDSDLKLAVDIIAVGSGTQQFIAGQQDFFISGIVSSHNGYQSLSIGAGATVTTFVPGQLIAGSNSLASAYVYSWNNITKTLIVSLNEVLIGGSTIRQTFTTSDTIAGGITITGTATVSNLYSSTFTVAYSDSTIATLNNTGGGGYPGGIYNTNPAIAGGSGAVSTEIWLHRPSIVNSSGHTWEYAGSGTDYNALPQNGGKSDFAKEMWSDYPGRVYSSGTNELGDFKVGRFIVAENRTGNVSFTNTVTVASLNVLKLALGTITITEISNDVDLGDNEQGGASDSRLSTQKAVRTYFKNHLGPFIDKAVSTNAVPNAIPQLNSSGQLDVSQIPAIRTFATYRSYGYSSRTSLVEEIPANDILNGDIGTELYSTVQLTLSANITALKGSYVLQANTGAEGYIVSDVTASNVITVGSVNSNFFKYTNGVAVNAYFNNTVANTLTIAGDSTPSDANGTVYPSAVGTIATGIEINYVLSNAGASEYLVLDPAGTYAFNNLTVASASTLVSGTIYKIVTLGTANWASIATSTTFTNPSTGVTTSTPTVGYYFTYNGVTITGSGGVADIYRIYSANENYYATLAGVSGGSLYRAGVLISGSIAGGTGYVGTSATVYRNVPLTNVSSSGANAIADITVTNGIVTNVDVRRGGTGYAVNDTLSASNTYLGGTGSGFVFTVGTIEKRLYVTIENGSKISANAVAPNFIQDNNTTIKTVNLTSTTVLNFNNANTSGGGNVNVVNNSFDITSHGFTNGDPVRLTTIAFGGLTTSTITYYVSVLNANSFRLYTNYNLSTVHTITGSGAGGANSGQFVRYAVDTVADTIVLAAHGYTTGTAVKLVGSGLPTVGGVALTSNTFYFVGSVTTNSFSLHTTRANALSSINGLTINAVDFDGTGSNTAASIIKQNVTVNSIINTSSVSSSNWSNLTTNNVDASNIISGTISTTRLGSGTANSSTFLRGDSSWQYAVQGIKEVQTPLTLTGSAYSSVNSAVFPGIIHGARYANVGTPVKSGTGPWTVTYSFTSTSSPTVPAQYLVVGSTTAGFNGTFTANSSSATSITITYPSDPGTWAGGTAYIYLETGNLLYVSSIVSGTVVPGMTLSGNGISSSPTIVANVSGNGSAGASVWTVSANLNINGGANITGTSTDSIYYGNVALDVERVDGNQTLTPIVTNYTNLGVASFNKTQFYTGQSSTGDLGQVYVKDGVIDAIKLNGQTEAFYRNPANLTSSVSTDKGGTNFSAYAVGDMLYATGTSGTSQLSKLSIGTANQILTSTGTAPQWSSNLTVPGNVTVSGNLTVNGITTTVNSNTITVDDKNLELGSVSSVTGFSATLSTGTAAITLTAGTTNGLIPGMALTYTGGAGAFGASARILSVDSISTLTATINHASAGAINFDVGGVTNYTADGGGITLKGATDKTIIWDVSNTNWTSSENWNIASTKVYKINNTEVLSATQVLQKTIGGTAAGDIVSIDATQTLTNKTLQDSTTTVQDNTNSLKKFQVDAAGVGGSGATFTVTTSAGGAVTAVNATPAAAGSGYAVNDVLTLEGPGSPTTKVTITVNTITAGGAIATFTTSTLPGTSAGYTASQTNVVGTSAIGSAVTTRVFTVPPASTTLVGTDSYQTLTNKTITLGGNTITGTTAQFNAALTDNNFATQAGSETLTNKTIAFGSNTVSGTLAQFNTAVTDADLASLAGSETLTNKILAAATTTLKDTAANISAKFTLSAGTGLQLGNITVTNGVVQSSPSPSTVAAGYGYAVGDRVYLNANPTGSGAVYQVSSVTATGGVTGLTWIAGGTLYAPQSGTLAAQTFNTTASTVDTETATRTYNLPSSDGSDVLVTQDATQTLTNKTLTTPVIGTSMIVPIVYGSSLLGGTLTLRGTSNATKAAASVLIDENITSTSTTSGSLVVTGGAGISENLWVGSVGYFASSVRSPVHTTNGATNLVLSTNNGTNSGTITINQGANANIAIAPNGTGVTNIGDTTASGLITTGAASANLVLNTNNGTNSGNITIVQGANNNITITANGTGSVVANTLTINSTGAVTSGTWNGSIVGATYGGTGVNNGSNTITIGGNISTASSFTTSGAAALTLTLQSAAATNATFPATGNITLAYQGGNLGQFAATTSAQLAGVISDETGSGVLVFGTSPSFTTDIRTPKVTTGSATSLVLDTNAGTSTGNITIASGLNQNIGITPNGTGVVNLGDTSASGLLTTGAATASLTLSTNNGTNSGTISINAGINGNINLSPNGTGTVLVPTINNLTITNSTGTLTITNAKTLSVSNTLTFTGTDSSSVAFGAGGTVAYTSNNLGAFASTTSAQLAGIISDETGSGSLVFATSPTLTTPRVANIYGGDGAAGTLTLYSTSAASKGQVIIGETTASTTSTTGALKVAGGMGVAGNVYTAGRVGFVNGSDVSAVYQYYNTTTGTLDTVFG